MKFFATITVLFAGLSAHADLNETVRIERSRQVIDLHVDLNAKTVRCLQGDYSMKSLKISLPDLTGITVFRQTTAGETAPCINAGACGRKAPDGRILDPSLILDTAKPTEDIKLTIVLIEELYIDHQAQTCGRHLVEELSSPVRGLDFRHADGVWLGQLPIDVCLKMKP